MEIGGMFFLVYFFPIFIILFLVFPSDKHRTIIFIFNILFYLSFGYRVLGWLIASASINYGAGIIFEKKKDKKYLYAFLMVLNLLMLLIKAVISKVGILPIGCIFTFENMVYISSVYNGEIKAEKSFNEYLFFISYFPVSQVGPVRKYEKIRLKNSTPNEKKDGIKIFIKGLALQSILAFNLNDISKRIFEDLIFSREEIDFLSVWIGGVAAYISIYFVIRGGYLLADGISRIIGVNITYKHRYLLSAVGIKELLNGLNTAVVEFIDNYIVKNIIRFFPKFRDASYFFGFLIGGLLLRKSTVALVFSLYLFSLWYIENRVLSEKVKKIPGFIRGMFTLLSGIIGIVILLSPNAVTGIITALKLFSYGTDGFSSEYGIFLFLNRWYIWLFTFLAATPALNYIVEKQKVIKNNIKIEAVIYFLMLFISISYLFI